MPLSSQWRDDFFSRLGKRFVNTNRDKDEGFVHFERLFECSDEVDVIKCLSDDRRKAKALGNTMCSTIRNSVRLKCNHEVEQIDIAGFTLLGITLEDKKGKKPPSPKTVISLINQIF